MWYDVIFAYVVWFEDRFWVFIAPFFYRVLRAVTEVVSIAILSARAEEDLEVISGELVTPLGLAPMTEQA